MAYKKHISDEARLIHNEAAIIDIHCHPSLKVSLYGYNIYDRKHRILGAEVTGSPNDSMLQMQYDLHSMREGNISAVWSSVYIIEKGLIRRSNLNVITSFTDFFGIRIAGDSIERCDFPLTSGKCYGPYSQALELIERMEEQIGTARSLGFKVSAAKNFSDFENSLKKGEMCFVHSLEGAHMLGRNMPLDEYISHLDTFKSLGVCSMTLGHFMPNNVCFPANGISPKTRHELNFDYAYSQFVDNGLLETGKDVVNHMLDIGMIVDLNHVNVKGRSDVYEINKARGSKKRPLVFTHMGVRKFCKGELKTPDDFEIKEIQECGGVIGIIFMNYWLCGKEGKPDDGLDNIINVVKYIAGVCGGSYDNIAVGTDMDGFTQPVDDLYNPSQMVRLTQAMLEAGISDENIRKVLGGNAIRVMAEGWG